MRFLTQRPVLKPSDESGKYTTFFADVFAPRLPFDEIVSFTDTTAGLVTSMASVISRKASPITGAVLLIDGVGACLLVSTSKRIQVQAARSAIGTMIATLPEAQQLSVENSIRPLDELDKGRIDDWFLASPPKHFSAPTTAAVAAASDSTMSARDLVSTYSDDVSTWFVKEGETPPAAPPETASTARDLLDALSDSEDDAPAAPLMLTDAAVDGVVATHGHSAASTEVWKDGVKSMAVIVVCCIGSIDKLAFVRCHTEERRIALLLRSLSGQQSLVGVVHVAQSLSRDGSLPSFYGDRRRKSEFLKRCAEALARYDPSAIREPKKLDGRQQRSLALAMDKRLCTACAQAPGICTGGDLSIGWFCDLLIDVPEVVGALSCDLLCGACARKSFLLCPTCGKTDSLQVDGGSRLIAVIDYGFAAITPNVHCTRCSRCPCVTPAAKRRRV